jgi:preprotein translocase subunit SecG
MTTFLTVLYVLVCIFLILVVLLQAGRGGGMGAAFGGGSTNTVFGGAGAGNFLQKLTGVMAAMFMLLSASLAYISSSSEKALDKAAEAVKLREEARQVEEDKKAKDVEAAPASTPEGDTTGDTTGAAPTGIEGLQLQGADGTPIQVERVEGLPEGVAPINAPVPSEVAPAEAAPAEAPAAPAKPAAPAQRRRAPAAAVAPEAAAPAAVDPTPAPAASAAPAPTGAEPPPSAPAPAAP